MFLFFDPPGHGHAVWESSCSTPWRIVGPLSFTNPEAVPESTHKPFIVMTAAKPNQAARINGQFCLLSVCWRLGHKYVQRAWSEHLEGPWTWELTPLIPLGEAGTFDEQHVDAVSGYYFPERNEILYFYMGYPAAAQRRPFSPYGAAQGVAVERVESSRSIVRKLGEILPPAPIAGHWASGWVGGLQLLPGTTHRWIGLVNASPTAPYPTDTSVTREEPAPSLGGFAFCDEEWPIGNWRWCDDPIEYVDNIPASALASGEGVNFWRHHLFVNHNGEAALLYNSGPYGQEQLFMKHVSERSLQAVGPIGS